MIRVVLPTVVLTTPSNDVDVAPYGTWTNDEYWASRLGWLRICRDVAKGAL